jgi:hypothetical protein
MLKEVASRLITAVSQGRSQVFYHGDSVLNSNSIQNYLC